LLPLMSTATCMDCGNQNSRKGTKRIRRYQANTPGKDLGCFVIYCYIVHRETAGWAGKFNIAQNLQFQEPSLPIVLMRLLPDLLYCENK